MNVLSCFEVHSRAAASEEKSPDCTVHGARPSAVLDSIYDSSHMFMTIHTYKIVKGDPLDIARIAQSEFLAKLETLPGFRQFHLLEGEDGEHLGGVGIFETREAAHEADRIAAEWIEGKLEGASLSDALITEGPVIVSSLRRN
jgi:heme-degrading monooxygenase HmoA